MSITPLDGSGLDKDAYDQADAHFKNVRTMLPPENVAALAKEVVRRLAFRMPRGAKSEEMPTPAEIERLCGALLSQDEWAGDRIIMAARRDGVSPETIYLGFVAAASRRLGVMWEEDEVSFLDVTLASGRLYRIIRGLRHVIAAGVGHDSQDHRSLFVLVPDETHTLGIEMATDLFRRKGWDVDLSVGESHDEIIARTEAQPYRSIVLVANAEDRLADVVSLVLALRITAPMAYLVVAGNLVGQVADVNVLVGADAVIPDIETAVSRLDAIVSAGH